MTRRWWMLGAAVLLVGGLAFPGNVEGKKKKRPPWQHYSVTLLCDARNTTVTVHNPSASDAEVAVHLVDTLGNSTVSVAEIRAGSVIELSCATLPFSGIGVLGIEGPRRLVVTAAYESGGITDVEPIVGLPVRRKNMDDFDSDSDEDSDDEDSDDDHES